MLMDVGMTVPNIRETSAVLYATRQGMRACNNSNMRNPSLHLFYGVYAMMARDEYEV